MKSTIVIQQLNGKENPVNENTCNSKCTLHQLIKNQHKLLFDKNRCFGRNLTNLCLPQTKKQGEKKEVVKREQRSVSCNVVEESKPSKMPKQEEDSSDPQYCGEYVPEIEKYLREIENKFVPSPDYMESQPDINSKMRSILVDWLVEVHLRFKLVPETLYLTINLIDRYLDMECVHRRRLQLVGVTAMFIASKYEEIYPPELNDFVYITDNAYTKGEILEEEQKMLMRLNFNLNIPSSYRFLERFCKIFKVPERTRCFSQYFLELGLIEGSMLKYSASMQAASTLYISTKLLDREEAWNSKMAPRLGYDDKQLRECVKDFVRIFQHAQGATLHAAQKKFSRVEFREVSAIKIGKKK